MTDMYDEKRVPDFSLPPYQHEDHGGPVSYIIAACVGPWLPNIITDDEHSE
jgi:hypothetical protein